MNGKLNDQPLAELIREISSKSLSGSLKLEYERARAAVYFEQGRLVFAASNVRTLRLSEYLTKSGLVTKKDLASAGNDVPDLQLARSLRAKDILNADQVNNLLAVQVADILRVALLWVDGSWSFSERARLDDPARVEVDIISLLREAAHRLPHKFVSSRLRNPNELISRAPLISGEKSFLPAESFILSRLDQPMKLGELVAISGLREPEAHQIIYGLALSGVVIREYWHNAFRTDPAAVKAPSAAAVSSGQSPTTTSAESRWGVLPEEDELEPFLARLQEATSHYEVMDLSPAAGPSELKDAYYALARRYHPDRFHLQSGTTLHGKLSSAFARITQAYETLMDPIARSNYDAALERARRYSQANAEKAAPVHDSDELEFEIGASETELGRAEYNFREGYGALQQGRTNAATTHLSVAARLEPGDARYRAYYGRALAANEKTRRLAENEIQAAVKLEPSNATYRTMLAELYFELKFHRRAEAELERALALEPENRNAILLSRKLARARKTG